MSEMKNSRNKDHPKISKSTVHKTNALGCEYEVAFLLQNRYLLHSYVGFCVIRNKDNDCVVLNFTRGLHITFNI